MESQEIPKAQEPQKSHEPKTEEHRRLKNHKNKKKKKKRKGTQYVSRLARKVLKPGGIKQKQAQQAPQAQVEHEPIRITNEPPPQERPPTVNVYKNVLPLCVLFGAVGGGGLGFS